MAAPNDRRDSHDTAGADVARPDDAPIEDARATMITAGASRLPRHVLAIIVGVFAVSLLKGLRMPNLWAATQMTFNYSKGFIRRGLFGQLLHMVGGDRAFRYNVLALVAVILFALATVATARLVRRTLATDGGDRGLQAVILVFAASPGVVFLAHVIGYLDYLGLIAVPLFIVWAARTRTLWMVFHVAVVISVVLALVHESMVVMFAPMLLLVMASHIVAQSRARALGRRTRWLLIAHAVAATAAAAVASSVISALGTRSPAFVGTLQASIARVANFPLRGDAFEVLLRTLRDNYVRIMPWHWSFAANRRYLVTGIVVSAPGLLVLAIYALRLIARLAFSGATRAALAALFVIATFSPLLLNYVGWDSARWNAICFVAAFNGIATLRLFFSTAAAGGFAAVTADGRHDRVDDPLMLTLAAAAIVFGLSSNYANFLFDGYVVQWFPFDGQLRSLMELFQGNFTFIPGG